jgi:hypothetical protein
MLHGVHRIGALYFSQFLLGDFWSLLAGGSVNLRRVLTVWEVLGCAFEEMIELSIVKKPEVEGRMSY